MEVKLTGDLEAFIHEKVRSGRYTDASDVVRDALRALEQREEFESPELEAALLEGVRSPHHALGMETLEKIRQGIHQAQG
jgi:antitoxin ParD1/3/4